MCLGLSCVEATEFTFLKQRRDVWTKDVSVSSSEGLHGKQKYFMYKFMYKFTVFNCRCFPSPIKRAYLLSTLAEFMSRPIKKKEKLMLSDLLRFMFPKYPSCNNSAESMRKADSYFLQVSTDIHPSKLFEPLATPKENQSVGTIYEHLFHLLRTILVHVIFSRGEKKKRSSSFSSLLATTTHPYAPNRGTLTFHRNSRFSQDLFKCYLFVTFHSHNQN